MLKLFSPGQHWLIVGPSGSGKTTFLQQLLLNWNNLHQSKYDVIFVFYLKWQRHYDTLQNLLGSKINFIYGLPESFIDKYLDDDINLQKICIFDDLMHEVCSSKDCQKLFTTGRHSSITAILLSHNIFHKEQRNISLNCTYYVLFKNPRDSQQISILARRMYSHVKHGVSKFLSIFHKATSQQPFGYLICDFRANTNAQFRLITNIFDEFPTVFETIA